MHHRQYCTLQVSIVSLLRSVKMKFDQILVTLMTNISHSFYLYYEDMKLDASPFMILTK